MPRFLLLAFLMALLPSGHAASDDGFRIFQDAAPEFIRVEISDVQVAETRGIFGSNRTRVSATGRVIEVFRSSSGLAPGSLIEIRYDHQARVGGSAETPPILESGRVVPAFLARKGSAYVPAARHHSFQEPTEAQMKRYDTARVQTREALLVETERRVRESIQSAAPAQPFAPVAELREEPVPTTPEPTPDATPAIPTADELPLPQETEAAEASAPLPVLRAEPVVETTPEEPAALRAEVVRLEPESPPTAPPALPDSPPDAVETRPADEPITPRPVAPLSQASPAPQAPAVTLTTAPPNTTEAAAREGYSTIYSLIKKGEAAQLEGRRDAAKESYILAREQLVKLKAQQPDFQPFMVEYRLKDLKRRLEDIEAAEKAEAKNR